MFRSNAVPIFYRKLWWENFRSFPGKHLYASKFSLQLYNTELHQIYYHVNFTEFSDHLSLRAPFHSCCCIFDLLFMLKESSIPRFKGKTKTVS